MLVIVGRGVMLLVWGFLLANLIAPYPRPLTIFMHVALVFMVLMHGLQLLLLKSTLASKAQPLTRALQWRIFIFGVFELLAMNKALQGKKSGRQ